jgi:hypothetical protein
MTDRKLQKATHEGTLAIGSVNLRVAVLDDGTRVLNRAGVFRAFGRTRRGRALSKTTRVQGFPSFIDAQNLQPYISAELSKELREFEYLSKSGKATRTGFKATILPEVCDVYLRAREDGALVKQQQHLAIASEIIVRSLSKVGIQALVDEASGYQEERDRDELQKILAARNDNRPDEVIKLELYKLHVEPDYKILFVLDDRNKVVDMWRDNGLKCLQVANGDF